MLFSLSGGLSPPPPLHQRLAVRPGGEGDVALSLFGVNLPGWLSRASEAPSLFFLGWNVMIRRLELHQRVDPSLLLAGGGRDIHLPWDLVEVLCGSVPCLFIYVYIRLNISSSLPPRRLKSHRDVGTVFKGPVPSLWSDLCRLTRHRCDLLVCLLLVCLLLL